MTAIFAAPDQQAIIDGRDTVFVLRAPNVDSAIQGPAATISIGNVTTGSPPSVTNVGTSGAAILDFVLPVDERVGPSASRIDNWNTISATGWYRGASAAGGTIGAPVPTEQMLVNHMQSVGGRAWQVSYLPVAGEAPPRLWLRYRTSGGVWGEWFELMTSANVGIFQQSSTVTSNLDTITVSGQYRTTSGTIGHPRPGANAVVLHTEGFDGRGYQIGQWAEGASTPNIATRYRTNSGVWGAWVNLADDSDINSVMSEVSDLGSDINKIRDDLAVDTLPVARPSLASESAIIVRRVSGQPDETLFSWGSNQSAAPASLIKIITITTALWIMDQLSLNWLTLNATVQSSDITSGSGNNLQSGDVLNAESLIADMLLPSSNTAATVLAREIGTRALAGDPGDPEEFFVTWMNLYLSLIGATDTVCVNPHGNPATGQLTTASDMAKVMLAAANDSRVTSLWGLSEKSISIMGPNARTIELKSSVEVINSSYVLGGKTGTINPGVNNLALSLDLGDGSQAVYVGLRASNSSARYADALSAIAFARVRKQNELGAFPIRATITDNFDTLPVSGQYQSTNATGHPASGAHCVVSHIEGVGGRGYQTAQWGNVVSGQTVLHTATRFRSSSGVWNDWAGMGGGGITVGPQRLVNAIEGQAYVSGDDVRMRHELSDFYTQGSDATYTSSEGLLAHYEQLETDFPDYVTSRQLGVDAWGNRIMEFTFKPGSIKGDHTMWSADALKHPKICVTTAVHPGERPAIVSTLCFFDDLCRRWQDDEMLADIRWNCEIVLVAPVNPSGINNGNSRRNGNDVDLNRNFPFGWADSTDQYKGPSPASELETQIMLEWPDDHPDAIAFLDHHSSGNTGFSIWYGIRENMLDTIQPIARKQHAWSKREMLHDKGNDSSVQIGQAGNGYMVSEWAETLGRPAFFLEGPMPDVPDVLGIPFSKQREMLVRQLTFTIHQLWSGVTVSSGG